MSIRYFNRWLIFLSDLFLSVFSSLTALFLAGYTYKTEFSLYTSVCILLASAACSIISFFVCKTNKGIIRHSTFTETGRIGFTALLKVGIIIPLLFYITPELSFRILLGGGVIDFFITFFVLTVTRVLLISIYRLLVNNFSSNDGRLLIYREEREVVSPLRMFSYKSSTYHIAGYLQFGNRSSLRIGGYPIYSIHNQASFDRLITNRTIKAVLFTDPHSLKAESERLVRYCEKRKIRMLFIPSLNEVKEDENIINLRNLPEVRIEDLLGRDEISINMTEIGDTLHDKVVLVTGAAGSIGSELCRILCTFHIKELILFDSAETPMHNIRLELEEKFPDVSFLPIMGDVRMPDRVESIFRRYHPQLVFHAAAYKHVPLMEENPCEAVYTNVYGTHNVADMAVKYNVDKFIMVSTDKAVNPTNVMGASKRLAEIYVQSLSIAISKGLHPGKTRFITTRFGNVLGSNGSVIPRFREQLIKGGPLTVTHPDIIRYFMTIPEACRLVLEAGLMGKGNEIFVFDMGTPVKIADLACRMIELAGLEPDVDIKIQYTGLRPGEKLYEELLATKENTIPTENKKIFRAQVREYDFNDIALVITQLTQTALRVDKVETVRIMKEIVPEFKSKNSVYEALDTETISIQK